MSRVLQAPPPPPGISTGPGERRSSRGRATSRSTTRVRGVLRAAGRMGPQRAVVRIRVEGETETALASRSSCCGEELRALLRDRARRARADDAPAAAGGSRAPVAARDPARRGSPDLRRTLRHAFRTGGDPVERRGGNGDGSPAARPPPGRLGLMDPYSRALVMFAHGALRSGGVWRPSASARASPA